MPLPRRAYLGAELPADEQAFTPAGVRIADVAAESMAARAGLAADDVLQSIASVAVHDLATLATALRRAGADEQTSLVYLHGGERVVATVDVVAQPSEPGATYGELAVAVARLRTIEVLPASPRALVLVLAGIACESVDLATDPHAPLARLLASWATAGIASLRVDKRGTGDSEGGPCCAVDFATELADARAAVTSAAARAAALRVPLILFGHSVGAIMAPRVADAAAGALRGIIVYGAPVTPWLAYIVDSVQRQLALRGAQAAEIAAEVAGIHALIERGELYGRSAAYHAQLAAIDIAAAWREITAPVLVVRGEHDWVVRADDQAKIAALLRGPAEIVDLPGLDHLFGWHADRAASLADYGGGAANDSLASATAAWLARRTLPR